MYHLLPYRVVFVIAMACRLCAQDTVGSRIFGTVLDRSGGSERIRAHQLTGYRL
jgi:hypothetical protein